MERLSFKEVAKAVGGQFEHPGEDLYFERVCIDSRKIEPGDLYIAIVGERLDGHGFVQAALEKGAVGAVVSRPVAGISTSTLIHVADTQEALWQLAAYYRRKLDKKVIGVTGSVGKTSTKDMIASVLSAKFSVHRAEGNQNNQIGMPLTVLGLERHHDVLIVEMGMRGLDEISPLSRIAQPDIAVITNIGMSHIERLGTQEQILKAKLEILDGLKPDGVLVLNGDDGFLKNLPRDIAPKTVTVGISEGADYRAEEIEDRGELGVSFTAIIDGMPCKAHIPAVGRHHVLNCLAGIACGIALGMTAEEIIRGIGTYQAGKMRLHIVDKQGIKLIDDCYNASPDSMKSSIEALKSVAAAGNRYAVVGSMFELGDMAVQGHRMVGEMLRDARVQFTAILGENAEHVAEGIGTPERCRIFDSHEAVVRHMKSILKPGDYVMVKGSRGMQMERILEIWDR